MPKIEAADRISVRAGEEFEINLTSTPSTGYDWSVANCPARITFIDDRYLLPASEPEITGSAGTHIFRFRTTVQGTFAIRFGLKRSWEKSSIRSRTFEVSVVD